MSLFCNYFGKYGQGFFAPDRKLLKALLTVVMSLQIVEEEGKCVANGANITGIFGVNIF
jgi:hypothetical protein